MGGAGDAADRGEETAGFAADGLRAAVDAAQRFPASRIVVLF